jgi:hypothetical protein
VRTIHHNRQARRGALCITARQGPTHVEPALSRRALALGASGGELAQVAETIADELELSPDLIDDLLWPGHRKA